MPELNLFSVKLGRALLWMIALLAFSFAATLRAEDAKAWLDRMAKAMQMLNYEGTFVYLHDKEVESMRIVHGRDDQGERERLISLNGEAREVIRNSSTVTCIWPGSRSVNVSKARPKSPFPTELTDNIDRLKGQYEVVLGGEERIAGRDSRIIAIKPKDKLRYGYRLWLDREASLLLRSDLLDEHERPVEQLVFTTLNVLEQVPEELFRPVLRGTGYTWERDDGEDHDMPDAESQWLVAGLPEGFELTAHTKKPMPPERTDVEQMVFSDGLASVSIFVEEMPQNQSVLKGGSSMGAVNAFGAVTDGYQVTVVGEVPARTVAQIARSVTPNNGAHK